MKIKAWIYFLLLIGGVLFIAVGEQWMQKEYALILGFVLLMFALYKISVSWKRGSDVEENEQE